MTTGRGCPWNKHTCKHAIKQGHVEVLRWARENGAPWDAWIRDEAAQKLGYTDDLGNLVYVSDDEYDYDGFYDAGTDDEDGRGTVYPMNMPRAAYYASE